VSVEILRPGAELVEDREGSLLEGSPVPVDPTSDQSVDEPVRGEVERSLDVVAEPEGRAGLSGPRRAVKVEGPALPAL